MFACICGTRAESSRYDECRHHHPIRPSSCYLGRIIALHGIAYEGEQNHFGLTFEAFVGRTIAEFIIDNKGRGRIFMAERGSGLVACAAMVERNVPGAVHGQLRWIIADPSVCGLGLGRKLVGVAMDYARTSGFSEVYLETTEGLDASMGIYKKLGFVEEKRAIETLWLGENSVITMRLKLA